MSGRWSGWPRCIKNIYLPKKDLSDMTTLPSPPSKDWLSLTRLEQVLYLANLGYKILPVHGIVDGRCTCGVAHDQKSNLTGKHPTISAWNENATSDPEHLIAWFKDREDLNYGIFMAGSGQIAIDIDVKGGGWESWWRLYNACEGDFPNTVQVLTGKNKFEGEIDRGAHMYFCAPEAMTFPANLKKSGYPSIDLRHNAYILGPGSIHKSGVRYEWAPGHAPWEIEVAAIPEIANGYLNPKAGKRVPKKSDASLGDEDWRERWSDLSSIEIPATSYASTALKNAVKEISDMLPGSGRNNALNAKAFSLGRLIGGGQLSLTEAKSALYKAAAATYKAEFAYKRDAVENTLRTWGGGFEAGALEPKYPNELDAVNLEWIEQNYVHSENTLESLLESVNQGFFKGQELQRMTLQGAVRSFGPIAVGEGKTLWSYADGYWQHNGYEQIVNRVGHLLGEKARPAHTSTLIHFMETETPTIKDLGPTHLINLKNGMLDWRSGELKPHAKEHYSTIQLPHAWKPEATCPTVDKFFSQVLHEELIPLMWEIIGICIYTGMGFQIAIILDGGGRNGKGTVIRLIEKLIPPQFVSNIDLQSFSTDKFSKAELFNKVLNVVGDLSRSALSDTAIFKQLTGQDTVTADFKYGPKFKFKNQATLLFAANELPPTSDTSFGFFERMLIVPFDKVSLEKHEIDETLEERMELELEGVLVKAVEGLRRAKNRGYLLPVERCQKALQNYKSGTSWLSKWADQCLIFTDSKQDRVNKTALYNNYESWASATSRQPGERKDFYKSFSELFTHKTIVTTIDGYEVFTNIRLK